MSYVFWDNQNRITLIHNAPEKLSDDVKEQGLEVNSDDIPEKENRYGQRAVRYIDPDTGDMWVEYEDRPLNEEERAEKLENTMNAIRVASQVSMGDKIKAGELSDDKLIQIVEIFPSWDIGINYKIEDLISFKGRLYEVLQAHTSQADWPPDTTASLFVEKTPEGVIAEWQRPTGAHDAYNTGDQVIYEDEIYESLIDGNAHSPSEYPAGWELQE